MQVIQFRYAVLIVVLGVGVWLQATVGQPLIPHPPRWPAEDVLAGTANWTARPATSPQETSSYPYISRTYERADGTAATLTIMTGADPKIYRAGADVPFLGSGFEIESVPPALVSSVAGRQTLVARRGPEQWLLVYAYGERRGLLGNGLLGWSLALADGALRQPNDYYKLFLTVQVDGLDTSTVQDAAELADTLFPRIAAAYGAA